MTLPVLTLGDIKPGVQIVSDGVQIWNSVGSILFEILGWLITTKRKIFKVYMFFQ